MGTKALKAAVVSVYAALVVVLAVATFVEQAQGTAFVERHVYHSYWFCGLWGALVILAVVACIRCRWWRRGLPVLSLHGSFLVILAGALTTFATGQKGHVHLTEGGEADSYVEQGSGVLLPLPFTIALDSFRVEHYPGTEAPADYVSHVRFRPHRGDTATVCAAISMNHIGVCRGYRFYQASYDEGERGSWLAVNHDPWGIGLTYAGYALLGLSMLWMLLARGGGFRRLWRHPLLRRGALLVAGLCWGAAGMQAGERSLPALSRQRADSLARVQVVYHDRVTPFNTLARDFVTKLYGRPTYGNLTPEQVVSGWLLRPEVWKDEPMIRIKSAALRRKLGLQGEYARLADLFDGQTYRLQGLASVSAPGQGGKPDALAKAVTEADEKVGLILMLCGGTLIRPLPTDGSVQPLSRARVEAELWYNRIPFVPLLSVACLVLGTLAFVRLLCAGLRRREAGGRLFRLWGIGLEAGLVAVTLLHALGYGLRWYIGGRVPLGNGYETMLSVALCALLTAALLRRRFPPLVSFGLLLAGFSLLVARLGQMDPYITPLMPVLSSPWLSAHVSLIMMAYALLAFLLLGGVCGLCLPAEARRLMLLGRLLLYPAVFLLGAGIFLGAVWANVSWGRYWAWDPKEVWALITFMTYSVPFHGRSLRWLRRPRAFHLYLVVAFLTVLTTYFGVNYLMGGMHSYA